MQAVKSKPQNPKYLNPETLKPKTQNIEPDFETPKHIKILKKNEVTEPQTNLIITWRRWDLLITEAKEDNLYDSWAPNYTYCDCCMKARNDVDKLALVSKSKFKAKDFQTLQRQWRRGLRAIEGKTRAANHTVYVNDYKITI